MGGRGAIFIGNGGNNNNGRVDNSPISFVGRNIGVTENAMKVLGDENAKDAVEYIADSMKFITGNDEYAMLSIDDSADGTSYAHMRLFTGQMGINPTMYKNLDSLAKQYADDVRSGWHPKGTGMTDVFVHETAHRLDAVMFQRNNLPKITSSIVVPEAIKAVQKAQKARGDKVQTSLEMQNSLSRYGGSFYSSHTGDKYIETFAEAIADYNKNKGNAHELSKEIVKAIQKYL